MTTNFKQRCKLTGDIILKIVYALLWFIFFLLGVIALVIAILGWTIGSVFELDLR